MTRTAPIGPRAVRDAATAALGRPVGTVERASPGCYALELRDGGSATLKLARDGDDERCLVEPCLLDALADTAIPTPALLAAVGSDTSPFGSSFCILSADGGQRLPDVLALPEAAHERLVREAGEHLAALHNADLDARPSADGGPYGDLRVPGCHPDAPPTVVDVEADGIPAAGDERWPERFERLRDRVVGELRGGEFDDLTGTVGDGLTVGSVPERPPAALLHLDYRPATLRFEPGVTWPTHARRESPVVRTVRGLATASTGDGLLDLAIAEDALIGLPVGRIDRARELTAALRESYVAERGVSTPFGERYAAYLLFARAHLLSATDDVGSHTREHDACEAGIRCRERVQWLADELR
jgi:hypothetical protein